VASDELGADFGLSSTLAATPLTITLPADGTYLLNANVHGVIDFTAASAGHNCRIQVGLRTPPNVNIPGTVRLVVNDQSSLPMHTSDTEATAPIQAILMGTAGTTVTLWAAALGSNCPAAVSIGSGNDGQTTLNAVRIN
jgi:hypothetical protein